MDVPILNASAWREYRGKPSSSGINETTHLAKIADQSGQLHNCFVKLMAPGSPALLCEAIGWILASASGVTCPQFAGIVLIPIDELRKHVALPAHFNGMTLCPAWFSEVVAGKAVLQIHKMKFFLARKTCLRSKDVRKIAAFDQWSDLRDRNFGNVIQSSKGGYVAIDHETLLHDLLWLSVAVWEERSLLEEARSALPSSEFKRFQIDMATASTAHSPALDSSKKAVENIIQKLLPRHAQDLSSAVIDLLEKRSAAEWLPNKLGVIA